MDFNTAKFIAFARQDVEASIAVLDEASGAGKRAPTIQQLNDIRRMLSNARQFLKSAMNEPDDKPPPLSMAIKLGLIVPLRVPERDRTGRPLSPTAADTDQYD